MAAGGAVGRMDAAEAAASAAASDAGWLGALACAATLLALRRLRAALLSAEDSAARSRDATLAAQLWHVTPPAVLRARARLRLQRAASTAVSGACLGCLSLCVLAPRLGPRHAAEIAAAVAGGIWCLLMAPALRRRRGVEAREERRLPVTIVTGFLGAGKSTLVSRLLRESHGRKLLVIENEVGEVGIDHELLVGREELGAEEIILLRNGCLCCTIRDDLRAALRSILPKARDLDGVVIETTGVARPAPIVQTFLHDPALRATMRVDAVVTVVDTYHEAKRIATAAALDDGATGCGSASGAEAEMDRTRHEQVAFADVVLLNKRELVSASEMDRVRAAVGATNGLASVIECSRAEVPLASVLDVRAFDVRTAIERHPALRTPADTDADADGHGLGGRFLPPSQRLDTLCVESDADVDFTKLNDWIGDLLKERGEQILRMKGIVAVAGRRERFVFHAVHMIFEGAEGAPWAEGERRTTRVVMIGIGLPRHELRRGLAGCVVGAM